MRQPIYFTPGPSALYPTVAQHITSAIDLQITSISHRSSTYKEFHQAAVLNVKQLLQVPDSHIICFFASATEIWERLLQNCVGQGTSLHFTNGVFSHRFYEMGRLLQKKVIKQEVSAGQGFIYEPVSQISDIEMMNFTHNESSTGVMQPLSTIYEYADANPHAIITLDIVSSAPFPVIDYNKVHAAYFSVQKGMGLPAGLGVLIAHPKVLEKAKTLEDAGFSIGSYHRFTDVLKKAMAFQTPETPNILNIYLLSKVTEDMLTMGVGKINAQTLEKATIIAQAVAANPRLKWFVADEKFRSCTVMTIEVDEQPEAIIQTLKDKGLVIGKGYGLGATNQIRIANFPAHSVEDMKRLGEELAKI